MPPSAAKMTGDGIVNGNRFAKYFETSFSKTFSAATLDCMGTTFVTLSREVSETTPGFWIRDGMLELWLRLLALHLPEPTNKGEFGATIVIRNQWLLASRGYFNGCVPDGLAEACATSEGRSVVCMAIDSLLTALQCESTSLDPSTLNLLGMEGSWSKNIERKWLIEIGHAFLDLLDSKLTCTATSTEIMPGSIPYKRV